MTFWYIFGFTLLFIIILFSIFSYHGFIERKLLSIRIHSPWASLILAIVTGVAGGMIASVLIAILGLQLSGSTFVGILLLSLVFSLIHIRYVSFFYAAGIFSIIAWISQQNWLPWSSFGLEGMQTYFEQVDVSSILALTGILYVVEALILGWKGNFGYIPTYYFGQRGKLVGGFLIQRFWLLPLFVFVPGTIGIHVSVLPEWWPLFGDVETFDALQFTFLPLMLGFTAIAIGDQPSQTIRSTRRYMVGIGIGIIALSYLSQFVLWLVLLLAVLSIIAHEALVLYVTSKEKRAKPYFAHSSQGMAILAVLPGSPAAEMGIVPGERLVRVNGELVTKTEELYAALQHNAAFCKLEVVNLAGNVKFLQRSLYSGEHYLLGVILAPDESNTTYLLSTYTNFVKILLKKLKLGKKDT